MQTPNMKIDLKTIPWTTCECGGKIFIPCVMFKRVSPLVSPDGQERMVPIEVFTCNICNQIPGFVNSNVPGIPKDLKATKNDS